MQLCMYDACIHEHPTMHVDHDTTACMHGDACGDPNLPRDRQHIITPSLLRAPLGFRVFAISNMMRVRGALQNQRYALLATFGFCQGAGLGQLVAAAVSINPGWVQCPCGCSCALLVQLAGSAFRGPMACTPGCPRCAPLTRVPPPPSHSSGSSSLRSSAQLPCLFASACLPS